MTLQEYIEQIKLMLTGGILELEISDEQIGKTVMTALTTLRGYIDQSKFITIPYADCIDLNGFECSSVVHLYRIDGFNNTEKSIDDPMYAQQWMIFSSGGSMYNLQNYLLNYMSFNTLSQIRNNTSTDLDFRIDKANNKLYPNIAFNRPSKITIEYIPVYKKVEDITSDYWVNILKRLSLALVKIILGRIRSKYKQSNALWTLDGDQLLEEGNTEYNSIMEQLDANLSVFYPID
jgi:hypothetical protein